jgi:putative hydrolase of the HAD superfamily
LAEPRLRAILFDMGDTLAYRSPPSHEILGEFLRTRGIIVSERAVHEAALAATARYYVLALARQTLGIGQVGDSLVDEYDRTMLASLGLGGRSDLTIGDVQGAFRGQPRPFRLFADARPTLEALRARGFRLAVVSNLDHDLVERCGELCLCDYFDAVVGSATVRAEKPDPSIFDRALDRLGVRPSEAWHVGDIYLSDVLGARAAGVEPVLLDRHDLTPGADCRRVRCLSEVVELVERATSR